MRKRIVDIGDVEELGCASNTYGGNTYGDAELEELGDTDMEAVGEEYAADDARASQGGFLLGSLVGGLLGVGLGAAGAVLLAHHTQAKKR